MRVRITTTTKQYKAGQIVEVSPNVGFGLIDSGVGEVSKEITEADTPKKKGLTNERNRHDEFNSRAAR